MGRERMLSGSHAASGRHVSTWAHAVLGGKVSSLGFSHDGGRLPTLACRKTKSLHAAILFPPLLTSAIGKTDTLYYEANCFFL
jgi:hypothetical protein